MVTKIYNYIYRVDDAITSSFEDEDPVRVYHVLIPGTFVEVG